MVLQISRPLDKVPLNQDGRLKLEWDAFFNLIQTQLNLLQRTGKFTMDAAASKTIADTRIATTSHVDLTSTSASAATLMGSANALYVTNVVSGVSFDVVTATGIAQGTETFTYNVIG